MRYRFGLSVAQYDPEAAAVLPLAKIPEVHSGRRRQQIQATLDGFVAPFDNGFTFAGQDMTFVLPWSANNQRVVDHVLQNYAICFVSTLQGLFRAAPRPWKHTANHIQVTYTILREIQLWQM